MSPQSLSGRKRRLTDESEPQTPIRRRKVNTTAQDNQEGTDKATQKESTKKPSSFVLSSPTDISDPTAVAVQQASHQVRTKQAKASGLPNLSLTSAEDPNTTKVDNEVASELESDVEAQALTPRPTTVPMVRRPPLSRRRAVAVNRARFVGIVRCRILNAGEETETEDESPAASPRPSRSSSELSVSPIDSSGCGCHDNDNAVDKNLEELMGTSVLPIDPGQKCFDRSFSEDRWQLRSPSPEEKFVPEKSCCATKTCVGKVKNDPEQCKPTLCRPEPVHADRVESN